MSGTSAQGAWGARSATMSATVAVAWIAVAGCKTVVLTPHEASWTVQDADSGQQAVWRVADVELGVPLRLRSDRISGEIRNSGTGPISVAFRPHQAGDPGISIGTASGGPPHFATTWSRPILPGEPIEVPPGSPGAPGTVEFLLRPDRTWSTNSPAAVTDTFTYTAGVTMPGGEAACPMRFDVTAVEGGGDYSTWLWVALAIVLVVVLVAAFSHEADETKDALTWNTNW